MGVKTQKSSTNEKEGVLKQRGKSGQPSVDEIIKMDTNLDGKLSINEVEGPLQRDFSKIDTNNDGFITRAELENAPKGQKGQRPPKNNR